jgi:hypothetical protein
MTCVKLMHKLSHIPYIFRTVSWLDGEGYIEEEFGRTVM